MVFVFEDENNFPPKTNVLVFIMSEVKRSKKVWCVYIIKATLNLLVGLGFKNCRFWIELTW